MNIKLKNILNNCKNELDDDNFTIIALIIEKYATNTNDESLKQLYGLTEEEYLINGDDYNTIVNELKEMIINNNNSNLSAWCLTKTHDENIYSFLFQILSKRYTEDKKFTKQVLLGIGSEYWIDQRDLLNIIKNNSNKEIQNIVIDIEKIVNLLI